jgi:cation transport ATPase
MPKKRKDRKEKPEKKGNPAAKCKKKKEESCSRGRMQVHTPEDNEDDLTTHDVAYHLTFENELNEGDSNHEHNLGRVDPQTEEDEQELLGDEAKEEAERNHAMTQEAQQDAENTRARKRARRIVGVTVHLLVALLMLSLSIRFIPSTIQPSFLRGNSLKPLCRTSR